MKWYLGAILLLLVGLVLQLGLLVYSMYALLAVLIVSRFLTREWTENVTIKTHPTGFWRDETDPDLFHYDLEYTFRHVL